MNKRHKENKKKTKRLIKNAYKLYDISKQEKIVMIFLVSFCNYIVTNIHCKEPGGKFYVSIYVKLFGSIGVDIEFETKEII